MVYRLKVIVVSSVVDNGGLSRSAAKGCIWPEVTSPFDSATTVNY